jgi:glutaredoxin 3
MSKVTVYTSESCPFCVRAKALLKERGVSFSEVKIGWDDDAQWDALFQKSKLKTVPQIFNGDALIGGFDALNDLDKKDQLLSLKS